MDFIWNTKKIILVLGSSLFLYLFHQCYLSLSKKPFSSFCQENPSKVCKLFIQKFHSCSLSKVCESGLSFFLLFDLMFNFKIPNLEMFSDGCVCMYRSMSKDQICFFLLLPVPFVVIFLFS